MFLILFLFSSFLDESVEHNTEYCVERSKRVRKPGLGVENGEMLVVHRTSKLD